MFLILLYSCCAHARIHTLRAYRSQGQTHSPQHFERSVRFLSACLMSWLIWSMPSSTRFSCSETHTHTHKQQFRFFFCYIHEHFIIWYITRFGHRVMRVDRCGVTHLPAGPESPWCLHRSVCSAKHMSHSNTRFTTQKKNITDVFITMGINQVGHI